MILKEKQLDREFIFENKKDLTEEGTPTTGQNGKVLETPITEPNTSVLNGDMIPVYYDNGWKKADASNVDNNWYDYSKQQWANVVTVTESSRPTYKDASKGAIINDEDINTMWVWIPRYSYTIKKELLSTDYYGKATYREKDNPNPTRELPGEIDVKFISKDVNDNGNAKYTGTNPSGWRTNDTFNFGGEARSGIWVGKLETTGRLSKACVNESCDTTSVSIKPGITSIRSQRVSSFFYMYRSMQLHNANTYGFTIDGDLHMMKNDEWRPVAYLSQSRYGKYGNTSYSGKNKEIYQNKDSGYITGSSNGTSSEGTVLGTQYAYNNMTDLKEGRGLAESGASTTGTIYGIYDMSGYEYVMEGISLF